MPFNNTILLIGSERTYLLKKLILENFKYNEINKPSFFQSITVISFGSIFLFLKNFIRFRKLSTAVIYTYYYKKISEYKPKVVIGFYIAMKNKHFFHLANEFKKIEFIAIAPSRIDDLNKYANITPSKATFYVHGMMDYNELVSRGYDKKLVYPYGSFYSHAHSKQISDTSIEYDICILSQYLHYWEDTNKNDERLKQIQIFDLLLDFISRYTRSYPKLRIAVAMRPQENGKIGSMLEKKYFSEKIGSLNPIFIDSQEQEGSSYKTSLKSNVIITHYSTLAFELLGFEKKVLFFQPYEFEYSPIPRIIEWKVMKPCYETFKKTLDNLIAIKDDDYKDNIDSISSLFNNMQHDLISEVNSKIKRIVNENKI